MARNTNPFIIFDFETGGFDPKINAIVEFAAIAIDGFTFREITRYEAIVKPYGEYKNEQGAIDVHGITDAIRIGKGVEFKVFVKELTAFFSDVAKTTSGPANKPILVAHNAEFDRDFMLQIQHVSGKDFSRVLAGRNTFNGQFIPKVIDSIDLSKQYWREDVEEFSHNLTSCCTRLGIEIINAHSAMQDVEALRQLFIIFMNKISTRSENHQPNTGSAWKRTFKFQF